VQHLPWSRPHRGVPFPLFVALALAAFTLQVTPAFATTYYVSPSGSDRASGTSAGDAWTTLRRVNRARLRPGDTVVLAVGVYTGQLRLDENGTATAPITITSSGPGRAVIDERHSGRTAISVDASHLRVRHLELRGIAHRPARDSDGPAVHLGRADDVTFSDMVVKDSPSAFFNGSLVATHIRLDHVAATGIVGAVGSAVSINNWASRGWQVRDSRFSNYGDSCVIDQAGRSTFVRVVIRHCGYSNLGYGRHGMYLKGPGAVVEDSDISDIKAGVGSCISPRASAVIRGSRLHNCAIAVGYFDDARRGGTAALKLVGNQLFAITNSAIYLDPVGGSRYTSRAHRLVVSLVGNQISATSAGGGALRNPAINISAPRGRGTITVRSSGNVIQGRVRDGGPLVSVFAERSSWPAGSSYTAHHNSYWDAGQGAATRFSAPGMSRPYRLQNFAAALRHAGSSSRTREWLSRVAPRALRIAR
jgi:hypothetical protein